MEQRGSSDSRMNPFRTGECDWQYTPDMCARSLDLLARTVNVAMNPTRSAEEREALVGAMKQAAK